MVVLYEDLNFYSILERREEFPPLIRNKVDELVGSLGTANRDAVAAPWPSAFTTVTNIYNVQVMMSKTKI